MGRLAVAISVAGIIPDALTRRNANASVESAYISAVAGFLGVLSTAAVAVAAFWYSTSTNRATIAAADATTKQTIDAAREAQVPDRYTKAIEQLGSEVLDVHIGGIYALERIARHSNRDHPTVMEVLSAFIREHSREHWPPPDTNRDAQERSTRPDVQAAVTVIGRRDATRDVDPVDLTDANLTGANLTRAHLGAADLTSADLRLADLTNANLTRADLRLADLGGANLRLADLTNADLTGAYLDGADLTSAKLPGGAKLTDADLTSAYLDGADLTSANLTSADLTRADLTRADLTRAKLDRARWSREALPPSGWELDPRSGRLKLPPRETPPKEN